MINDARIRWDDKGSYNCKADDAEERSVNGSTSTTLSPQEIAYKEASIISQKIIDHHTVRPNVKAD
jgi:hypothetical protein